MLSASNFDPRPLLKLKQGPNQDRAAVVARLMPGFQWQKQQHAALEQHSLSGLFVFPRHHLASCVMLHNIFKCYIAV